MSNKQKHSVRRLPYEEIEEAAFGFAERAKSVDLHMDAFEFWVVFMSATVQKQDPHADPRIVNIIDGLNFKFNLTEGSV
jgi:hypothetical protein